MGMKVSRDGKYIGTASNEDKHYIVHLKNGANQKVKADSIWHANALFSDSRDRNVPTVRDLAEVKKKK